TKRAAACVPTPPCCATTRISSSTTATPSTLMVRSSPSRKCRTARSGKTSCSRRRQSRRRPLLDVFMLDMRSYRGPNGEGMEESYGAAAYSLGPAQVAWLKRELLTSQATWKVIAADMPIGLIVVYDTDRKWGVEAIAQGDGPPRGRELEIADLLSFIKRAG